jgi:hypothetical protein
MSRTIRDYGIRAADPGPIRAAVREWLTGHGFKVLEEHADGNPHSYYAPEVVHHSGRVGGTAGSHLVIQAPSGSLVAYCATYAPGAAGSPVAYALLPSSSPGVVNLHGEFFFPGGQEGSVFGHVFETGMTDTMWAPAGIARKRAYPLFEEFEAFVQTLGRR